jgi:hypothetical protein
MVAKEPLDLEPVGGWNRRDAGDGLSGSGDDVGLAPVLDAVQHLGEVPGDLGRVDRLHIIRLSDVCGGGAPGRLDSATLAI